MLGEFLSFVGFATCICCGVGFVWGLVWMVEAVLRLLRRVDRLDERIACITAPPKDVELERLTERVRQLELAVLAK